jgi:hypothetical protein
MYAIHSMEHRYATPIPFSSSTSVVLSGWVSRPFRPHRVVNLSTQGVGLRPRPWAGISRPVGPAGPGVCAPGNRTEGVETLPARFTRPSAGPRRRDVSEAGTPAGSTPPMAAGSCIERRERKAISSRRRFIVFRVVVAAAESPGVFGLRRAS